MTPPNELLGESEVEQTGTEGGSASENESSSSQETESETTESDQSEESESSESSETETPPYEANYKYKVLQKEKEIPEKFRSLIQNAEDEKELRELFERADGLEEHFKPKFEANQQALTNLQAEHNHMLGTVQEARELYQRNDLDAFFEKLAIPQQKILQYALEKINYQDLPPEQKAMVDARRNAERAQWEGQRQTQNMQRQYQQQVQQAHDQLLSSELARTDVKSVAEAFDQRAGKPGAFMQEVANRGRLAWFQSQGKTVLTPSQAVEQVISLYGLKNAPEKSAPHTTPQASGGNQGKTSTIPNVGSGKSSAPLKQKPRSIEDLKKMHRDMVQREA